MRLNITHLILHNTETTHTAARLHESGENEPEEHQIDVINVFFESSGYFGNLEDVLKLNTRHLFNISLRRLHVQVSD
jgi:hypothetical protein